MGLAEDIRASIYEEHLDEASFLYEQRGRYLEDPEVGLDDVAELDARLQAHLDGLVLGGAQALALCREQIEDGDAGAQHAALRVFCRSDARVAAQEALELIAGGEPASHLAAAAALAAELPDAWVKLVEQALGGDDPCKLAIWSYAVGYRRLPLAAPLLAAVARVQKAPPACAWALGELRDKAAEPALLGLLWRGEPAVAQAAAVALLKCRSSVGEGEIEALAGRGAVAMAIPLSLTEHGRHSLLSALAKQAQGDEREGAILALGLAGDLRAVPGLLDRLTDDALARPAAASLLLLTGAALTETAEVPPPEDDALDDDLIAPDEAPAEDESPERPATELRLCRDPARWQEWLASRQQQLEAHARLRMGGAASIATTTAALTCTALPLRLRRWLADDLAIRFGVELRYRPDMPIVEQRAVLAAIAGPAGAPFGSG